jgi:hypothetical protein
MKVIAVIEIFIRLIYQNNARVKKRTSVPG